MSAPRCLVAMSGGVDSSVAAALMQHKGYDCTGITLLLTGAVPKATATPFARPCTCEKTQDPASGMEDAKRVCELLGMPHYTLDRRAEFSEQVIEPFVRGYLSGITPNPCIDCNRVIKFGTLLSWARQEGFDCMATGHYARIEGGRLYRALDAEKDQSYVLYMLTCAQLGFIRLPLGAYRKEEVRELALGLGLTTAHKQESQDICYVPDGKHVRFIEAYAKEKAFPLPEPGAIITTDGTRVGRHNGIHNYTIGQRRGLGIASTEPLYVLDKDPKTAVVLVGTQAEQGKRTALLDKVNCTAPEALQAGMLVGAKHRYRGSIYEAQVFMGPDNTSTIRFLEKQRDITKGQALVLYDGSCVLGGGTIRAIE